MTSSYSKHDWPSNMQKDPEYPENRNTDLNEVMRRSLQRFQSGIKNLNVIVRCENLPVVAVDQKDLTRVFESLVQMIIAHPPADSKLYLYVDCEEENRGQEPGFPEGNQRYFIRFHTNLTTSEEWKAEYCRVLDECAAALKKLGAGFTVNEIKNTGCLFSISLSGKL